MKELLILGGGTAGSMMANKLQPALPDGWRITVVDKDDLHIYQPGLLFLPFGGYNEHELVKPRGKLLNPGIRYIVGEIDRIDPSEKKVALADGNRLDYDLMIVATGTRIHPEKTPGMMGPHWHQDVFDFYTLEGSAALARKLERIEKGKLVIHLVDMPIKCPVAPLEFAFLADAFLTERGIRDKFELVYATPLDGAFTKPVASRILGDMMDTRGIKVVPDFNVDNIDGEKRIMKGYDGTEIDYDLLVTIPLHGGAQAIIDSGMGDDLGFVPTHKNTLKSLDHEDIFILGDATNLPTSKAGAVAHFQGDVLIHNILRHIADRELLAEFDGHANCFIETGHGKAMLLDFNYDTQPLPGRFPLPGVGPFTLLEESAANHWGKLAFKWVYWNMLVKGKDLPLDHRMTHAGKWS